MGKSGIIARKIAATLASTGTPAFFLHPAEAIHGDLGVVQADDVVVALSHSGETPEILRLLETMRRIGARMIALTGVRTSTLGQSADVALDCHVAEEACPMNLAPTASTTASLALGDALAMALLVEKGFRPKTSPTCIPGGKLGQAADARRSADARRRPGSGRGRDAPMPRRHAHDVRQGPRHDVRASSGGRLAGIITDGDLRRRMTDGRTSCS